jgi:hypothetical protein
VKGWSLARSSFVDARFRFDLLHRNRERVAENASSLSFAERDALRIALRSFSPKTRRLESMVSTDELRERHLVS